jgi:signal peptidase I
MLGSTLKRVCIGSNWRHTVVRGAVVAVLVYLICTEAFLPFKVSGGSMEPLYKTGDFGFLNALAYRWSDPQRFDIVAIEISGRKVMLLKRIIGLPGETITIRDGVVSIDGKELDENAYLKYRGHWNLEALKIGANEYMVIGDNRDMPSKQHQHGKVERRFIAGRMTL